MSDTRISDLPAATAKSLDLRGGEGEALYEVDGMGRTPVGAKAVMAEVYRPLYLYAGGALEYDKFRDLRLPLGTGRIR